MWIQLESADGHRPQAFCARPDAPCGAVVILQEIFGVNPHIQQLCDRYRAQGWLAVAPALFDRVAPSQSLPYDTDGIARGRKLKAQVSEAQALLDVQAAIDWAGRELPPSGGDAPPPVAVIGFCWGGTLAWLAAARLSGLRCAVAYYGTNIADRVEQRPRVPMLLHFGMQDQNIPPADVDRIATAWPEIPLYRYAAGHGFNCDDRPAFHAASAAVAGERTTAFLKENLAC